MRNRLAAILVLTAVAAPARRALAEPAAPARMSSLAWVRLPGAESCIAAAELAQAAEKRLGRAVFVSASAADVTVEATIAPRPGGGFQAKLAVSARDGTLQGSRELETRGADCRSLDERLSLVVSMLIDPSYDPAAVAAEPVAAEPVVIERERVVERERIVLVPTPAPAAIAKPWRVQLGLAFSAALGAQPGLGVGVIPSVSIAPPRLPALLVAAGWSAPSSIAALRGARVEGSFVHGLLAVCPWTPASSRWQGAACAGALLGSLQVRGVGFDTSASSSAWTAGPIVHARAAVRVGGPVWVFAGLTVLAAVQQAELRYRDGAQEISAFRSSPIVPTAEIGVLVQLPFKN